MNESFFILNKLRGIDDTRPCVKTDLECQGVRVTCIVWMARYVKESVSWKSNA